MSKTLKQKLVAYALVLPAFLVVMLTVAYPIVSAVIQSFQDEKTGEFTLANYAYFFTEPAQRMNILYTLFVVVATVVIALLCSLEHRKEHRHAVPAAAFRTGNVCGLRNDHDHP